jgi:phosphoglycolate phosphatase-like HAD superfamily hydrolase
VISQATIRSAVGLGARVMIEEALRRAGAAEDIDEMLAEVLVHYEANIAAESRPFPGAVASLEMLAKAGQGSRCARTSANISRASCSRRLAFNITFTALRATTRSPCRSRTRPRHPCDRVCRR